MCFGTLVIPDLHQEYLRHLEPLCFVQAVLQVLLLELLQVAVLVLTVVQLPDFHLRDFLVKHLDFPVPLLGECLDFPVSFQVLLSEFPVSGTSASGLSISGVSGGVSGITGTSGCSGFAV